MLYNMEVENAVKAFNQVRLPEVRKRAKKIVRNNQFSPLMSPPNFNQILQESTT